MVGSWILLNPLSIICLVEERGWTLDKLAQQDQIIRERGYVKTFDFVDDVSFRYSGKYIERPINILLKKQTYMDLSEYHGTISV